MCRWRCPPCAAAGLNTPFYAAAKRRFWEATSGICYRTLQYADSQVNKLEITADKTLIAAAGNPHIRCVGRSSCAVLAERIILDGRLHS